MTDEEPTMTPCVLGSLCGFFFRWLAASVRNETLQQIVTWDLRQTVHTEAFPECHSHARRKGKLTTCQVTVVCYGIEKQPDQIYTHCTTIGHCVKKNYTSWGRFEIYVDFISYLLSFFHAALELVENLSAISLDARTGNLNSHHEKPSSV